MEAQEIDLNKYLGTWYEQARFDNFFERKCKSNISAKYTLLDDGSVEVLNSCTTHSGKFSKVKGSAHKAKSKDVTFKVTFAPKILRLLPFVWANYTVLYVDPNYEFALVGEPSKKYRWFLSRAKKDDSDMVERGKIKAQEHGYDLSKLIYPE